MSKPPGSTRAGRAIPPVEQQRLIAEQTEAFLAKGNRILQIPRGVSGQPKLGGPQVPAAIGASSGQDTPRNDPA
jgi:hypothetical protein